MSGDILLTKAQAIAHGISPNDPFDQGLALALREKWPIMHKDYRHFSHQKHPHPGDVWEWGGFGVRIFNLLTQNRRLRTWSQARSGHALSCGSLSEEAASEDH